MARGCGQAVLGIPSPKSCPVVAQCFGKGYRFAFKKSLQSTFIEEVACDRLRSHINIEESDWPEDVARGTCSFSISLQCLRFWLQLDVNFPQQCHPHDCCKLGGIATRLTSIVKALGQPMGLAYSSISIGTCLVSPAVIPSQVIFVSIFEARLNWGSIHCESHPDTLCHTGPLPIDAFNTSEQDCNSKGCCLH
jgi:hypothetical protein